MKKNQPTLSSRQRIFLGVLAVSFYVIHGATCIGRGGASNLLWACHIGSLVVGIGLLLNQSRLNAVGILWLVLGNGMWILYLAGGGIFEWTSPLTHVGGLVVGILGIRATGFPKGAWWWALAGLAALQQISRWVTVEAENVNLAFRVHPGWESIFPSYGLYLVFLLVMAGLVFLLLEVAFRKWFDPENTTEGTK